MRTLIELHYKKNKNKLVKVVARRLSNDRYMSEDAVQEAYARAIRFEKHFDPNITGSFDAWFSRILNNAVVDIAKDNRNRGVVMDVDTLEDDKQTTAVETNAIMSKVFDIIGGLSNQNHKEVLSLYYISGANINCISELTDNTHSSIRKIISRFSQSMVGTY